MNLSVNCFVNSKNKYSFGSLKENMRIGEDALKSFKKEYPYIKSNTFVTMKLNQHIESDLYKNLNKKLMKLKFIYDFGVGINREYQRKNARYGSIYSIVKKAIAQRKYGNCGEESVLLVNDFKKWKEPPQMCFMEINNKKTGKCLGNHIFPVIGIKKNVDKSNPKRWGNEAVVVDPWLNVVMKSRDAIEYFKTQFCFDSKEEMASFTEINLF